VVGNEKEVQFGKWLRVATIENRFWGGRKGRSNGPWKGFNQALLQFDTNAVFDGKDEEFQGQHAETGKEETSGNSSEASAEAVRVKGDTSALRDNLLSSNKASRNLGDPTSQVMYKLNVLASARVVCNMVVCKYEIELIGSCVLESKFKSKLI
jgi:hypothetical protein